MTEDSEIVWRAPEYDYHPKSGAWYWLSIAVTAAVVAAALWQRNFLFAVFAVIAEFLIIHWAGRPPAETTFKIGRAGLDIGENKFYSYADLESFALESGENFDKLVFKTKGRFGSHIRINVDRETAPRARDRLQVYLPEEETEESFVDSLSKILRF